ncbi:MAG: glycerol-3-phosphate 1-O-acyltransferase PlsY [Calditrichaeota bacterium]|nr:glycerol-3-phosphate 1-O-acyltransferase PlsY [Calditrichota bacterium]
MGYVGLMVLISYLIGSIPTSIITGKVLKGIDIREHGSGNAGATNVFRVLGWKAGVFVLVVDMLKGLIPTIWVYQLALKGVSWPVIDLQILAGLSAVFGHIWTVFAGFRGGKGVGTGAGVVIGLAPIAVLVGVIVFIVTVAATRYVSLGSILASLTVPITLIIQRVAFQHAVPLELMIFSLFIPVLIIFTHRSNIQRLLKGQENRIQFSKSA